MAMATASPVFPIFLLILSSCPSVFSQSPNPFCSHKPDGLYAEPRNPSYFWRCSSNGLRGSLLLCPPATLWNQSSLTCTNNSTAAQACHQSSNRSSEAGLCRESIVNNQTKAEQGSGSNLVSAVPNNVWSWNGVLHCYGEGCTTPATMSTTTALPPEMELGVPCVDGRELLLLAERYASAWIPAPRLYEEGEELGSHHWKVRFDSLEKGSPSILQATVTDYSPAQKTEGAWQGGPGEAKFAVRGPLRSGHGGCYYGVTLEKPSFNHVWAPFLQALSSEGMMMAPEQEQEQEQQQKMFDTPRSVPTMQRCIRKLPWPRLLSTALCFAGNANIMSNNNAFNRLGPCISFSPSDLSSLATCITAFANLAPTNSKP